ncbi:hypothetical protein CHLNCDRAFT_135944 [Chlorella variabilis]|uniref:Uncharacterized protein n=1 Tax=Chlorella variabilis TaxID=554065 RepID=E1ZJF3_CHLVA|nr:hypothetical protein CHLNCDRAFT_135944 [Chlorella variabilis]EFN53984.1 hypothetical protein CHLNCDRAFT_135944 [Chlorella variabilis]|eukprot:XP_005846086.1 hypothetical protein CHLNCDRAFT_135944 [Chlorella variabilis]
MELADRLYQAACDGDETAVRKLLAAGARADQANEDGWLPLHFASSCGHEGEAAPSTASAAPATALAMEHDGWTPLHRAAERGNIEALTLLLEVAPELAFAPDAFGETALHQVLRCGHSPADRVLEMARCLRSTAEAGWLVGQLVEGQRERLRAAALTLARGAGLVLPISGIGGYI